MIKSLYPKFQSWSEKGSAYLYSDPHFEDDDMAKYFDYATPEEQIENINRIVTKNDYFICLGDCGDPSYFEKIKCKNIVIILGNHDQSATKFIPYAKEIYTGPLFIGEKILLSHEPIGLPFVVNIHGHDHSNMAYYRDGCKYYNVAANVINYQPVSLGKLIKDGLLANIPSIHRITIDRASNKNIE